MKKHIAGFLALLMLFSVMNFTVVQADGNEAAAIADLAGYDWAAAEISDLAQKNIVNLVGENAYAPGQNITRADLAMFLIRALGLTSDSTENFADVPADAYYAKELAIGKAHGVLKGVDAKNFNPAAAISRQDMMTICFRGLEIAGKETAYDATALDAFADKAAIADYAAEAVKSMVASGIIKGDAAGNVNPLGNTTRAEAAVIMSRIMAIGNMEQATEIEFEDVTFAEEPTEDELKKWEEAKAFLTRVGIVDEDFDVTSAYSRAEAAELFIRVRGNLNAVPATETAFKDVPVDSDFAGYIDAVSKAGYMPGITAKQFAPGKALTYNQALQALINILGYGPEADSLGGYLVGYLSVASHIDLMKGTSYGGDAPIEGGVLAQLIRNAMSIDLVEEVTYGDGSSRMEKREGHSLLTDYFGILRFEGLLTADYFMSVQGGSKPTKAQVAMGGELFEIGDTNAAEYLGQRVIIYAENTDERQIVDIMPKSTVVVTTVTGDQVNPTRTTENVFAYTDAEDDDHEIGIAGATLVLNGRVKTLTRSDLMNVNGTIKLICNNGVDADMIFVENYTSYVVDRVLLQDNKILFKDGSEKVLDTTDLHVKTILIDAKGEEITLEEMTEWGILSIAESATYRKVVYCSESVTGEISEYVDDEVIIGEKTYKISPLASITPVLGKEETFYFDFLGNIVEKNDEIGDITYGYFVYISKTKGMDGRVQMKILTTGGELKIFDTIDKVQFTNSSGVAAKVDVETLLTHGDLVDGGGAPIGQLVVYKTNDEDKIVELQVAVDDTASGDRYHESMYNTFSCDYDTRGAGADADYIIVRGFTSSQMRTVGSLYRIDKKTVLFKVPNTYSENPKDYTVYDHTALDHTDDLYEALVYDIDKDLKIGAVVMEAAGVTAKRGGTLGVITGIRESVSEDGFVRKGFAVSAVTGDDVIYLDDDFPIAFGAGQVITDLATDPEVVGGVEKEIIYPSALQIGDVIAYGRDDKGEVNALGVYFRAHHAPARKEIVANDGALRTAGKYNDYYSSVRAFAPIEKLIDNGFVINPQLDYLRTYMFGQYEGKGPLRIVMYDMAENEFKDLSPADVLEGDHVFAFKCNTNVECIFIYRNMPQ